MSMSNKRFHRSILSALVLPIIAIFILLDLAKQALCQSYVFTNVADSAPAPGYPNGYYVPVWGNIGFSTPSINQKGNVSFLGRVYQEDIVLYNNRSVFQYRRDTGNTVSLLNFGSVHIFGNTYRPFPFEKPIAESGIDVNNNNEVGFHGLLSDIGRLNNQSTRNIPLDIESGVFILSGNQFRLVKPTRNTFGITNTFVGDLSLNDNGLIAYFLFDRENTIPEGYYINDNLIKGTNITEAYGGFLEPTSLSISINNSGSAVFWQREDNSGGESITLDNGFFPIKIVNNYIDPFSAFDTLTYNHPYRDNQTKPSINEHGSVAFFARTSYSEAGIYLWHPGISPVLTVNAALLGSSGAYIVDDRPNLNDNGDICFLTRTGSGDYVTCYVFSGGNLSRVIGMGDTLFGSEVKNLKFSQRHFNNAKEVAFYYELSNGRFGVALATPTNDPPTLKNVASTAVASRSATIVWSTNIPSTSVVEYGPTTAYGRTVSSSTLRTSHSINLTNLNPATLYHFRVRSKANGKATTSSDMTFVTFIGNSAVPQCTFANLRKSGDDYAVDITMTNRGDRNLFRPYISIAALGGAVLRTPLGLSDLSPGASQAFTLHFPNAGPSGTPTTLSFAGLWGALPYIGNFSFTWRVVLP